MGFWRIQGLVNLTRPCGCSRTRKIIKKAWVFKHFQKKWCWRSSPVVARSSFCRMLQLICLFLLQNALGSLGTAWGLLGSPWDPFGTPLGPLGIHGSDPCIWSMNLIHGSDPWIRSYDWLFDAIWRLSEALVCFRASGANFLRSITRAVVNKNDGKRKIDFLMLFWDFQKLSFVFAPPGITFCALSPGL